IAFTWSKLSAGSSAASLDAIMIPALLNAVSSRPNVATVRSTSAATWSSSDTSQTTPARHGLRLLARRLGSQRLLVDVGKRDAGALLGERARCGKPHPGARSGDEGDLTLELV